MLKTIGDFWMSYYRSKNSYNLYNLIEFTPAQKENFLFGTFVEKLLMYSLLLIIFIDSKIWNDFEIKTIKSLPFLSSKYLI